MLMQPTGVLRASLPVDIAITYMAPIIGEFSNRYPGIAFDFDLTPRQVNLATEPFDVAIRIGTPDDSQLIARHLADLPGHLYASPGYLARAGEPVAPADLQAHQCLHMRSNGTWTLADGNAIVQVAVASRFTVNSAGFLKRLALLDQGIVMMPEAIEVLRADDAQSIELNIRKDSHADIELLADFNGHVCS